MHPTTDARRTTRRRRAAALAVGLVALAGTALVPGAPAPAAPGAGPATAPPPGFGAPGTPERPASERYVRDAYQAILGRGIDEPGLRYWGERLDGGYARAGFARQLTLSAESIDRHLAVVYAALGRDPSTAERDDHVADLRAGRVTIEQVFVAVLASNEFYEQHGSTAEGYVQGLYQAVLGRAGEPAGVGHWVGLLDGGASRTTVARGFVLSLDRLRVAVTDAYDRVLGRGTDLPGRDHWVDRMRRGAGILEIDRQLLASPEAWTMGCSALGGERCLLPFPNVTSTVADATTDTGRRVVLKPSWVPAPAGGPAFDPTEWNRQDGFSPGTPILLAKGAIDPERSGLATLEDIGSSLDEDAPIYLVDVDTGERWPYWVEVDTHAPAGPEQALVIRPARNLLDGHTYAVGIGRLKDAQGELVPVPTGYRALRDPEAPVSRRLRPQQVDSAFAAVTVAEAGMDTTDLHLAWSFPVASTRNLAERIVHMRDEALAAPAAPTFTVTRAEHRDDQTTRVEGTFVVPNYLTGTGAPGSRLHLGDDDLPEPNGSTTAPFVCTVPDSARTTPARAGLYGHGLLGTGGQANSGYVRDLAREHNMVFCGTDWIGMAEADLPNVAAILQDLSRFPQLADRTQQGILNFQLLGRLMTRPDGLVTDPAFQGPGGAPAIAGDDLVYYGLSQGGIMGGALVATSTDITRGVLGVPGMNYSTLLERSVDFDPFFSLLAAKYTSPLDRILMLSVIQMLWDRGEANGYANHVTADPLPGTPTHEVLLQVAFGDHQVSQFAADVMARTYGAATNDPPLAPGRLPGFAEPLWGIDRITSFPHAGSAIVYWDSGTPAPPTTNQPNRAGDDPHSDPRADPDARDQISQFLVPDGPVVDVCGGSWCEVDFA